MDAFGKILIVSIVVIVLGLVYSAIYSTWNVGTIITQSSTTTIIGNYTNLYSYPQCSAYNCKPGQRVSNFVLLSINASNQAISGYRWYLYPVARVSPVLVTLKIGDTVGYTCDGTLATLSGINQSYAIFSPEPTTTHGACPI